MNFNCVDTCTHVAPVSPIQIHFSLVCSLNAYKARDLSFSVEGHLTRIHEHVHVHIYIVYTCILCTNNYSYVHWGILHVILVHICESLVCRVLKDGVLFASLTIPGKSSLSTSLNHTSLSATLLNLYSSYNLLCLFIWTLSAFQLTSSLFDCVYYPICCLIQPLHLKHLSSKGYKHIESNYTIP